MLTRRHFLTLGGVVLASMAGGYTRGSAAAETVSAGLCATDSSRPLVVALLSDSHIQPLDGYFARTINRKLSRAIDDLRQMGPDLWVFNGDITEHGYPDEFNAFKAIAGRALDGSLLATGNHEFFDPDATDQVALRRFQEAFGLARPYSSRVVGGVHFVMLADEQYKTAPRNEDWAWLTPEQLTWFEQVLAEHRDRFTVVCLHQPLQDTVAGSEGNNNFAGSGQVGELRAILKRNPQVRLWFSGHTHVAPAMDNQVVQHGRTLFLGLGSTCYLYVPASSPTDEPDTPSRLRKDRDASQSRIMEVWPDRVVVRTRDHTALVWLDELEVAVRRTQMA